MSSALPTSARLTFRQMRSDDLDDLHRLLGDPAVMAHYPRPRTREEALVWIQWNERNYARDGFGLWMLHDDDGRFIGDCGLTWQVVDDEEHLEIGYHLMPEHQGKGLATEAAIACRELARARGVEHLIAIIRPGNVASHRVAVNVGMVLERRTVDAIDSQVDVFGMQLDSPVPRRDDVADLELVGGVEKRQLVLVEHDDRWPGTFRDHEERIRRALGSVALEVEHIGSTSVSGLAAKPIIDILVLVPDITADEDYVAPLVAAGYVLRVREPGHRLLRTPALDVHVHFLQADHPEARDQILFRDHLRADEADRDLYQRTKRELLAQDWPDMNAYAEAKTEVITTIKDRARAKR